MNYLKTRNAGFTLTELAIVMVIMALLIGGMIVPLSAQQDLRANAETTRQLDEIREALIGYAIAKGHFPCAAKSATNGNEEDRDGSGKCTKLHGLLPWVTLSVQPNDSWGHLFQYSVTSAFSNGFSIGSDGDITIKTRDNSGSLVDLTNKDIPAVVLSTGKNGHLSWTLDQAAQNADSASSNDDEDTNDLVSSTGKTVVSRTPTSPDASGGEFDDLVTWISFNILINRMVAANQLP